MIKRCTLILMVLVLAISASGEPNRKRQNSHSTIQELAGIYSEHKNASDIKFLLTTNQWLHSKFSTLKNAYTHKLDRVLYMETDVFTGTLEKEYLDAFVYDEAWRATSIIEKEWGPDAEEWKIWAQTEIAYNNAGLTEQLIRYDVDDEGETLIPNSKIQVYYNEDNRVSSIHIYSTEDDDKTWYLMIMQNLHYNSSGALIQVEWVEYNEDYDEWFVFTKTRFTYDASGRIESRGVYIFMEGEDEEEEEMLWRMTEYFYNNAGRLSRSETKTMSETSPELQPYDKTEYTYDADGDVISITSYEWGEESWVPDYRDDYAYRADLNFADAANPYAAYITIFASMEVIPLEFMKAIDEVSGYKYIDGNFNFREKDIHYYSPTSATTDEYTLRYYAGSNGQIIGETTQTVPQGGNGTEVEAVADEGYHFTEWSDGVTTPKRTDTNVSSNITATALFAVNTYTISAGPNNAAYGSVSGTGDYSHGQTATLTATSSNAQIYVFINWTENGNMVHEAAEYSFTVTENRTLMAHFQNVTTVNKIKQSPAINTFPNPAKYSLIIESPVVMKNIRVYDTSGRQIIFEVINDSQHVLNTSSLRTGSYILQANTTEGSVTTLFLVE